MAWSSIPSNDPPQTRSFGVLFGAISLLFCAFIATARADIEASKSYFDSAQKELQIGNVRAAEIELRNALQADPNNAGIRTELAALYLRLGNFPAAEIEIRTALAKGAIKDRAEPILAQALLHQRRFDQLFAEFKSSNLSPPAEAIVRLQLGLAHLQLGEIADAEPLLREAETLAPKADGPKLGMAGLLLAKRDLKGAQAEANAAIGIAPKNPDALRLDGEILRLGGNDAGALARFNQALAVDPNHVPTLISRANLLIAKNDLAAAQKDMDHLAARAPNNPFGVYLAALVAAKSGKFQDADEKLQRIANALGSDPAYLYFRASVKFELHQFDLADADIRKFLARTPGNPNGTRLLGLIALAQRRNGDAIKILEPYVAAHQTDQVAISALGRAYMADGNYDKAVELFQSVANAKPDDPRAQMQLAVTQLQTGETSQAIHELEGIVRSGDGAKIAGPLLAMIDLRQGRVADAAGIAEKIASADNQNPVTQTVLSQVRFAQGNYPAAEKILGEVIKRSPKFVAAWRDLARLYLIEGRPIDAQRVLKELLVSRPDDERTLLELANLALAAKQSDDAEAYLRRSQRAHPQSAAAGIQLVRLYMLRKNWNGATALARELAVEFPNDLTVQDLLDQVRVGSGDIAGALADMQHLAQKYPKSALLLAQTAALQVRQKDMTGARKSLLGAIALAPGDLGYKQALVDLDFETKGIDVALETARSFAAKDPVLSELMVARVLAKAKRVMDALAVLAKAQQQKPSTGLLVRLAELTYQAGNPDQAIDKLQSWTTAHPEAEDARLALATLYLRHGQRDEAKAEYQHILADMPANAVAANNLATIYDDENDPRARAVAEQAYRELPTAEVGDTLGWILLKAGDVGRAMFYLRNAGEALPGNPLIQYHLAVGLDRIGDKKNAIVVLERVVNSGRSFANKPEAQKLLEKLQHG